MEASSSKRGLTQGISDVHVNSSSNEDGSSRDQQDMARLGKKQELNVDFTLPELRLTGTLADPPEK